MICPYDLVMKHLYDCGLIETPVAAGDPGALRPIPLSRLFDVHSGEDRGPWRPVVCRPDPREQRCDPLAS